LFAGSSDTSTNGGWWMEVDEVFGIEGACMLVWE
jgi:hypothetical protein